MKLIIAGSRDLTIDPMLVKDLYFYAFPGTGLLEEIVSGNSGNVDIAGERWAASSNGSIKVTLFPADWNTHGKAAGPIRNRQMAEYADALLLIWDGESRGSANMKKEMQKLKKPIYEVILRTENA
jgi:hypothetical protein